MNTLIYGNGFHPTTFSPQLLKKLAKGQIKIPGKWKALTRAQSQNLEESVEQINKTIVWKKVFFS